MIKIFVQEGTRFTVEVQKQGDGYYTGLSEESKGDVQLPIEDLVMEGPNAFRVKTASGIFPGRFFFADNEAFLHIKGQTFRFHAASAQDIEQTGSAFHRSPMPGKVIAVQVSVGDSVQKDQTVIIVEAMKMENAIKAGLSGKVKGVHCKVGDLVSPDLNLVEIEG